jgi:hypothetical protein
MHRFVKHLCFMNPLTPLLKWTATCSCSTSQTFQMITTTERGKMKNVNRKFQKQWTEKYSFIDQYYILYLQLSKFVFKHNIAAIKITVIKNSIKSQ